MPPAKAGVDSRAAQLIGFPRKFMVPLNYPTYEIENTAPKERGGPYGLKTTKKERSGPYGLKTNSFNLRPPMSSGCTAGPISASRTV